MILTIYRWLKRRYRCHKEGHEFERWREIEGYDRNPLGTLVWRCGRCNETRTTPLSRYNPLTGKGPNTYCGTSEGCDD